MNQFDFEGIGTHWKLLYFITEKAGFNLSWQTTLHQSILEVVASFDSKYSRFKKDSLVWNIARSDKQVQQISSEFSDILSYGHRLMELTYGRFNPAVGKILENLGYDAEYSFRERPDKENVFLDWQLKDRKLYTPQPILFDIGGWGKGYLIDMLADMMHENDIHHFLIDGGGDVYATSKPDGSSWKIALEHPTNQNQAFAMLEIKDSAVASSGSTKRKFGTYHHLIDINNQTSTDQLLGVHVQAETATIADGTATALFVSEAEQRDKIRSGFELEYVLISPDLSYQKSDGFTGNIFT